MFAVMMSCSPEMISFDKSGVSILSDIVDGIISGCIVDSVLDVHHHTPAPANPMSNNRMKILFPFPPYTWRTAYFTSDGVYPYLSKYFSASAFLTPLDFRDDT